MRGGGVSVSGWYYKDGSAAGERPVSFTETVRRKARGTQRAVRLRAMLVRIERVGELFRIPYPRFLSEFGGRAVGVDRRWVFNRQFAGKL